MAAANALRIQIERSLQHRFPAALSPVPRTIRETAPTGIPEVDSLLDGGLPVGAISEIIGLESSGRTSLALAFLASRTSEGRVCAWVDAADSLDAESAAASGVRLKQLLWVRCRRSSTATRPPANPWPNLDRALRATDLLLQSGGFAALVLDLGSIDPQHARRIPLSTWFRFRQAADRARASLLVLAQAPLAQSSASAVIECASLRCQKQSSTVLTGFHYQVRAGRQRQPSSLAVPRKPPVSTWTATSPWQRESPSAHHPVSSIQQFPPCEVEEQVLVADEEDICA
jgi:hypothetical protein